MKNFVIWLTEQLTKEDGFKWEKEQTISLLNDIHTILLSEGDSENDGKHYGDCTKQNITCTICEYQTWLDKFEDYCRNYNNK